jgi:ABC-type uncharacterized transport system permease subunit
MRKETQDIIGGVSAAVVSCLAGLTVLVLGLLYWDEPWWLTVILSIPAGFLGGLIGALPAAILFRWKGR